MKIPLCHCLGQLAEHHGLLYCASCGCYYREDGQLDPGHTACRTATALIDAGSEGEADSTPRPDELASDEPEAAESEFTPPPATASGPVSPAAKKK